MRILFDQAAPLPLRRVSYSTTDQNLRHQQNLSGRRIAILVLTITNWPMLKSHARKIAATIDSMQPGEYREWVPS